MIEMTAKVITVIASSFLICLALSSFVFPARAVLFLASFANTKRAHFTEMSIRLLVGVALIITSKAMAVPEFHYLLGIVLVVTSVAFILIPWQYHQKFATIVVPPLSNGSGYLAFWLYPWG